MAPLEAHPCRTHTGFSGSTQGPGRDLKHPHPSPCAVPCSWPGQHQTQRKGMWGRPSQHPAPHGAMHRVPRVPPTSCAPAWGQRPELPLPLPARAQPPWLCQCGSKQGGGCRAGPLRGRGSVTGPVAAVASRGIPADGGEWVGPPGTRDGHWHEGGSMDALAPMGTGTIHHGGEGAQTSI